MSMVTMASEECFCALLAYLFLLQSTQQTFKRLAVFSRTIVIVPKRKAEPISRMLPSHQHQLPNINEVLVERPC